MKKSEKTEITVSRIIEAAMDEFGNPSSLYSLGAQALSRLDESRAAVAAAIGCKPKEVVFTSGGTESNNTALLGAALAKRREGRHIVTSAIEHPSVLNTMARLEQEGHTVEQRGRKNLRWVVKDYETALFPLDGADEDADGTVTR